MQKVWLAMHANQPSILFFLWLFMTAPSIFEKLQCYF